MVNVAKRLDFAFDLNHLHHLYVSECHAIILTVAHFAPCVWPRWSTWAWRAARHHADRLSPLSPRPLTRPLPLACHLSAVHWCSDPASSRPAPPQPLNIHTLAMRYFCALPRKLSFFFLSPPLSLKLSLSPSSHTKAQPPSFRRQSI